MVDIESNQRKITVDELLVLIGDKAISLDVDGDEIVLQLNQRMISHDQLDGLYEDDHPQYLDQIRHSLIDHAGILINNIGINDLNNVYIANVITGQTLEWNGVRWVNSTSTGTKNHSLLDNLNADSHPHYMHTDIAKVVTASHVYDTNGQAFVLSGKSINTLVRGLNAELLNGNRSDDFASKIHTHVIYDIAPHTHFGSDIISAVNEAKNADKLGGYSESDFSHVGHKHNKNDIVGAVNDSDMLGGKTASSYSLDGHNHDTLYAKIDRGVTGGNNHTHDGVNTARVPHENLTNTGTNTHPVIDSHIASKSNPHNVTASQLGLGNLTNEPQIAASLITAKGDIIVGLSSGIARRLPVGSTNGMIQIVDNTQPLGIRYATNLEVVGGPYSLTTHNHNSIYASISHNHDLIYAPIVHYHANYLSITGGILTGPIDLSNNRITSIANPSNAQDAATKDYVDTKLTGISFGQNPVLNIINNPPSSPTIGDRYIVGTSPTGAFALYPNYITQFGPSTWQFTIPTPGTSILVKNVPALYIYSSIDGWNELNIIVAHGALTGLLADDHTQYVHISNNRTITAIHTFNNSDGPFIVGGNASGKLVSGLNADKLDGYNALDFAFLGHTHVATGVSGNYFYKWDWTLQNLDGLYASLAHIHDNRYYTKTNLQTAGQAQIDYGNLVNVPAAVSVLHAIRHQVGGIDQINVGGLSGLLADAQTPLSHDIISKHTASGLTPGYFLKTITDTTFGFVPHGLSYIDVGAASSTHNHDLLYASINHNHDGVYAPMVHYHDDRYSLLGHNHDTLYAAINHTHSQYALVGHDHNTLYAPIAKGVTNGDNHDHNGGDGAQLIHSNLTGIGTNTHSQIDSHIANTAIHTPIDDNSITTTNGWSASKIVNYTSKYDIFSSLIKIHDFEDGTYDPNIFEIKSTLFNGRINTGVSPTGIKTDGQYSGNYALGSDTIASNYDFGDINNRVVPLDLNHVFVILPDNINAVYTIVMYIKRIPGNDERGTFCGFGFGENLQVYDIYPDNIYKKYRIQIVRLSSTIISIIIEQNGIVIYSNTNYNLTLSNAIKFGVQTQQETWQSIHFRIDNVVIMRGGTL